MSRHRKSATGRMTMWRVGAALLGVVSLVVAMAVTGSVASAESPSQWAVTAGVAATPKDGLPSGDAAAALKLTALAAGSTVQPGDRLTYVLQVTNNSGTAAGAQSVTVVDDVSALLAHATITSTADELTAAGIVVDKQAGTLSWTPSGALAGGQYATATFQATVNDDVTGDVALKTSAAADGESCDVATCATSLTVQGTPVTSSAAPTTDKPTAQAADATTTDGTTSQQPSTSSQSAAPSTSSSQPPATSQSASNTQQTTSDASSSPSTSAPVTETASQTAGTATSPSSGGSHLKPLGLSATTSQSTGGSGGGTAPLAPATCGTAWPVSGSPVAGFEIDGNLCLNGAGTYDWSNVGGQPVANDGYGDSTEFTGGADERNWPWTANQINGSGTAPGKTDIGNVYAWTQTSGGDVYAYLGFERQVNTGSVAYHVELNRLPNSLGPVPNRSVGDLRLTIEQNGNNTIGLVGADTWNGTAWVSLNSLSGFIGQVNQAVTTNLSGTSLAAGTFAEAAIDLTTLFGQANCSGSYGTLNVRSSASPEDTSSLADWIEPVALNVPSTCASVQVNKSWVIDGATYANGSQPFGSATLSLTGQTAPQFGTTYATHSDGTTHYQANDVVTVGETVSGLPAGCADVQSGDLSNQTLTAGLNSYTVTNTVTCTYLTLVKSVNGSASPTAWTLTAGGPTPLSGASGASAVTRAHVAPGSYTIGETGGPTGYTQTSLACVDGSGTSVAVSAGAVTVAAGATITCTITNTANASVVVDKTWVIDGTSYANGHQPTGYSSSPTVTGGHGTAPTGFGVAGTGYLIGDSVTIGEDVPTLPVGCTNVASGDSGAHTLAAGTNTFSITNTVTCTYLTLVKDVNGGSQGASAWTLTATGATTFDGVTGTSAVTKVHVAPGAYTLSESGPAGYQQTNLACSPDAASGDSVTLAAGDDVTCTFTNTAVGTLTFEKAWVDGLAGDSTLLHVTGGTDATSTAAGTAGTQTDTSNTVTVNVLEGQSVNLLETLGAGNGASYTSAISCDQDGLVANGSGTGGTYTMPSAANDVTCTVTNTRTRTTLVLNKLWENGFVGDTATMTAGSTTASAPSAVVTGAASEPDTTPSHEASITVLSGQNVDLSEALGAGNHGTYVSSLSCSAGQVATTPGTLGATSGTVTVPKTVGSGLTCTFTNVRTSAQLTLRKHWIDGANGDTAGLSMSGSNPAVAGTATSTADGSADQVDTVDVVTKTVYSGQPITLGETLPASNVGGYDTTMSCTASGLTYTAGDRSGTFTLPGIVTGAVTCTYTNTRQQATLTVRKAWVDGAQGDATTLSATGSTGGPQTATSTVGTTPTFTDTGNMVTVPVFSGATVPLSEVLGSNNKGGYTTTATCSDGTTISLTGLAGSYTMPQTPANVTCTVTNTRTSATVTVSKTWVNGAAGDTASLSATGSGHSGSGTSTAAGGDQTDASVASITVFSGDTVDLGESIPAAGHTNTGTYTTTLACGTQTITLDGSLAGSYTMPQNPANVTCTYTNTRTSVQLTLRKHWINGADGDTAGLTMSGSSPTVSGTATSTANGSADQLDTTHVVTETVYSGQPISLAESLTGIGGYTTGLACTDPSGANVAGLGYVPGGLSGIYTLPGAVTSAVTCTFTNTRTSATLTLQKRWVNGAAGDSADLSIAGATAAPGAATATVASTGSATGTGTSSQTATMTVLSGQQVSLSEMLSGIGGYDTALSCTDGTGLTYTTGLAGSYTMPKIPANATCTFTNTRTSATITLIKQWVDGAQGDQAGLTVTGSDAATTGSNTSTVGTTASFTDNAHPATATIFSGETVTLGESLPPTGHTNVGSYTSSISCTPTTGFAAGSGGQGGTLTVPATPTDVTCTVVNTRTSATLTLQKSWTDGAAGDTATLQIDGATSGSGYAEATEPGSGNGLSGSVATTTILSGQTVTVSETPGSGNTGAYTTAISCTPADGFTASGSSGGSYAVPSTPVNVVCTVTNTRVSAHLVLRKQWVNGADGDSAGLAFSGSSPAVSATATSTSDGVAGPVTDNAHSAQGVVYSGQSIDLSEALSGMGTYTSALSCDGGSVTDNSGTAATVTVPKGVAAGTTITCTVTNTRTSAQLVLQKEWVNGAAGDTADLSVSGGSPDSSGSAVSTASGASGAETDAASTVTVTVFSGDTLSLGETLGTNRGSYTTSLSCTDNGPLTYTAQALGGSYLVPGAPADNTCTVTNTRTSAQLTLRKYWIDGAEGDAATLSLASNGQSGPGTVHSTVATDLFTGVQAGDSTTVTVYSGDTLTLSEALGAGNKGSYDTTLSCGNTDLTLDAQLSADMAAPSTDVTCTFTNARTSALMTLAKVWDHPAAGDTATLTAVDGTDTQDGTSTATGAATQADLSVATITVYSGDAVAVSEAVPATGTNVGSYTSALSCSGGNLSGVAADGRSGTYTVPAHPANVTCTFTNTRTTTTLTLVKQWVGGMKANSAALAVDGSGQTGSGTATATVPNDDYTGVSTQAVTVQAYSGDTADLSEVLGGPNASYSPALSCDAGAVTYTAGATTGSVKVTSTPAGGITCTFTNTAVPASWQVVKTSDPATGSVVGPNQTITYTLTATHLAGVSPTGVTVTDDLSDVVNHAAFGTITVTAPDTATYDAATKTLTWTISQLDDTDSISYTVTVDADADNVVLRNHASGGTTGPCATACSTEHVVPAITKAFVSSAQNAPGGVWDGTWNVTYTVSVHNPSTDTALTYQLSDAPGFPNDVTVNDATVSAAQNVPDGSTTATDISSLLTNTWHGAPVNDLAVITGRSIPAASTDSYTVVVNATVPAQPAAPACGQGPGSGFYNAATAAFGDVTFDSSACGPIPSLPVAQIAKSVHSLQQNADGSWTITYDVAVTNPDATLSTKYDLSDTLHFGGGITVTAESVTAPAGITANPNWNGGVGSPADPSIVTGQIIAAGATNTYVVTATATVTPQASSSDRDCTMGDGENGTGFLNSATVSVGTSTASASACASPVSPTIVKTPGTATQHLDAAGNWDGTWDVTYTITVTNPSAASTSAPASNLYYQLSDTPAYPAGVTANSASVTSSLGADGKPVAEVIGGGKGMWSGGTLTIVSSTGPRDLAAGDSDSYDITVNAAVPPAQAADTLACQGDTAGHGFDNVGTATSGDDTFNASACVDIPQVPTPTITKTVASTTQNADGTWTVVYDVVVTNPSGALATQYDVTDTLAFGSGITVNSASVTGPGANPGWDGVSDTAVASGQFLGAAATAAYTVTVNASVASSTGTGPVPGTVCQPGAPGQPGQPGGFGNNSHVGLAGAQQQLGLRGANAALQAVQVQTDPQDAYACSEPVMPTVTKTFVSAMQHAGANGIWDGTWDVTYTVTVGNPSTDASLSYDLTDTPAFPADVTVNGGTVTGQDHAGAAITVDAGWNGTTQTQIVSGRALPAGQTDTYTVVVNAAVPDGITVDAATCSSTSGPGHGFYNATEATSGENHVTADACGNIPSLGAVNIAKTVSSVTQNADGTWTVAYDLAVTNPSVDQSSRYNLSDAIAFGAGITVKSATVTGPQGAAIDPAWSGVAPHTSIVSGRIIAPHTQEHYTVTVVAAVGTTATTTDRDCTLQSGETGTGFLNTANLTAGGHTSSSQACASPVSPTITKKVASVTDLGNGASLVAYDVVVTNPSTTTGLVYNLADTLGFPADVAVSDQHASWVHSALDGSAAGARQVIDGWTGAGDTAVLATGRALPAATMDTYRVEVTATVPFTVGSDQLVCSPAGAGHGFFNTGAVTSGNDTRTATACADIPPTIQVLPSSSSIPPPPTVAPTSSTMAYTGVNTLGMGWLAFLLLGGGGVLLLTGTLWRRKPRRH